jgi:hypothetical protein
VDERRQLCHSSIPRLTHFQENRRAWVDICPSNNLDCDLHIHSCKSHSARGADLKIAENSTNYSLQNTVRAALLLPTSREAKYKAKAAIETFCVRLGDVSQAGVIFIGTSLHFGVRAFAGMTLAFTLLWLFVAFKLYVEHKRQVPEFH